MTGMAPNRVLRDLLRAHRSSTVTSSVLVAGHQLAEAAVPVVVGLVIDRAVSTGEYGALGRWIGALSGVFVVLAAAGFGGYWLGVRTERRAGHSARMSAVTRVLDPAGGAPGRSGELVSLASSDADRTGLVCEAVALAVGALAALAGGAVVLLASSVRLAAVVLVGVVVVLVVSRLLARPLVGRAEAEQESLADASAVAADLLGGLRVIRGIGAERAAADRYREASRAALVTRLSAARLQGTYQAATAAISGAFLVVVAWVGGRLALDGSITVGQLVAGVGLAQFLVGPLERLTELGALFAQARGSAVRMAELLTAPPAVRAGTGALPAGTPGALRLAGLDVPAGAHVGVVTRRPADAAALLDVLARESDGPPDAELDGIDLRTLTLDEARRTVLVARHDAMLFEGTVADNIGATDARVLAAAAVDELADSLPAGLATEVTDRGRSLSGGQRQRIALARALAADPAVLVLHDPTTAVDAATEHRVAAGLRPLRRGRTTVLITSSPALLAGCDTVVLLEQGTVLATGTHAELVAADQRYRAAVLA